VELFPSLILGGELINYFIFQVFFAKEVTACKECQKDGKPSPRNRKWELELPGPPEYERVDQMELHVRIEFQTPTDNPKLTTLSLKV
jgi:hypothetical protein